MWCVIGVEMTAGGECELDTFGRSQDPRRAGARILDTAEGVLIALRGCSLNQAFVEIVQTAKAHNVSTLSLADALVALTQNHGSQDGDDAALVAARAAWGHLFDTTRPSRGTRCGREDDGVAGA
jgi:ANTAR domain